MKVMKAQNQIKIKTKIMYKFMVKYKVFVCIYGTH